MPPTAPVPPATPSAWPHGENVFSLESIDMRVPQKCFGSPGSAAVPAVSVECPLRLRLLLGTLGLSPPRWAQPSSSLPQGTSLRSSGVGQSNIDGTRISDPGCEGRLEADCVNKRASCRKGQEKAKSLVKAALWFPAALVLFGMQVLEC